MTEPGPAQAAASEPRSESESPGVPRCHGHGVPGAPDSAQSPDTEIHCRAGHRLDDDRCRIDLIRKPPAAARRGPAERPAGPAPGRLVTLRLPVSLGLSRTLKGSSES